VRLRPLVIAGAGGFARETVGIVDAINARTPQWEVLGFLDDDRARWGTSVGGLGVLPGGLGRLTDDLGRDDVATVVCVGSPRNVTARSDVVARLGLDPERYATLVHPDCSIARSTTIGAGSVLSARCVTTADVSIGEHVAVMPSCVFTHDDTIDSMVTFGAGVCLAGGVNVARGAYVGAGAIVREYLTVGAGALVGMGSAVTRDVPPGEVWAGVPARRLRHRTTDDDLQPLLLEAP
jgi:sugar O-acyltransferase (sialic acid O-acetyltransferase NeuD family)